MLLQHLSLRSQCGWDSDINTWKIKAQNVVPCCSPWSIKAGQKGHSRVGLQGLCLCPSAGPAAWSPQLQGFQISHQLPQEWVEMDFYTRLFVSANFRCKNCLECQHLLWAPWSKGLGPVLWDGRKPRTIQIWTILISDFIATHRALQGEAKTHCERKISDQERKDLLCFFSFLWWAAWLLDMEFTRDLFLVGDKHSESWVRDFWMKG